MSHGAHKLPKLCFNGAISRKAGAFGVDRAACQQVRSSTGRVSGGSRQASFPYDADRRQFSMAKLPGAEATIGLPDPGSNAADFLAWADATGHSAVARLLLNTLPAVDASAELGHVADVLARSRGLLACWAAAGDDPHGLASLATALVGQERVAVRYGGLPTALPATNRLRGVAQTHYLQLVLISGAPLSPSISGANFDRMRVWLLFEALARAAKGNLCDGLLRTAANGLRQAGRQRSQDSGGDGAASWLSTVAALHPPSDSFTKFRLYLIWRCQDLLDNKSAYPPGSVYRRFLEAVGDIANGHSAPVAPTSRVLPPTADGDPVRPIVDDTPPIPGSWDLGWPAAPDPTETGGDEDADDREVETDVDPEESSARQEGRGRYVFLVAAARARFALWEWETVNPRERPALAERIRAAYESDDLTVLATAAFVDVALHAGRSLTTALRIAVAPENRQPGDWHLELRAEAGFVARSPPRRAEHKNIRARIDPIIRPEASSIRRRLPKGCNQTLIRLGRLFQGCSVQRLIDLWPDKTRTPTQAFADWLRDDPALHRLTPGMLGPVAMSQTYSQSGDWLLARLLYAPPNSGLPAAASYAAYSAEDITTALAAWFADPSGTNAAGSLIDAGDAHYRRGFVQLASAIDDAAGVDFIRHHNLVTLYIEAALRAATGVRPADGVWLWANVDLKTGFAFVDDKTGTYDAAARWVALPKRARRLLKSYAERHLPNVKDGLRVVYGQAAEDAITILETGLTYIECTAVGPRAELLGAKHRARHPEVAVEAPLPTNAFRHRARTVWRRFGCDQEVIDSLFGHSDGATRTHGDISPRIWAHDFKAALPSINAAFDALQIAAPTPWPIDISPIVVPKSAGAPTAAATTPVPAPDHVSATRWRHQLAAARLVLAKLSLQALALKPDLKSQLLGACSRLPVRTLLACLPSWSEAAVSAVVSSLTTTTDKGMPAQHARPCLRYLGRLADRCWSVHRQPFRLRRRTFRGFLSDDPRATSLGIGARHRYRRWLGAFGHCVRASARHSISPLEASTLLAMSLLLESRVTDMRMLEDAVRGRLRPVRFEQRWYVEWWADEEPPAHGHGVVRYRVRDQAAQWLSVLIGAERMRHSIQSQASKVIRPLLEAAGCPLPCSIDQALRQLVGTVEALNYMELPGNVAAARAGRFLTASRSWPDWTRAPDGSFLTVDPPLPDSDDATLVAGRASLKASKTSGIQSRLAAEEFCDAIRGIFAEHRVGGVYTPMIAPVRRNIRRSVDAACRKHEGAVSSALQALGQWTTWLFNRELHGDLLALSSIARYFSALAPRFEAVAHDVDLLALDSEGATRLYADILSVRNVDRPSYVFSRLREFDRFCASTSTMPRPDWSELGVVDVGIGISPGYVDEPTYLRLLKRLKTLGNADLARKCVVTAILGYRFGLRAAEAALARVRDVIGLGPEMYVIVERTKDRDVKTDNGRRTVPLLFLLTSDELEFLQPCLAQARERARTARDALLSADPSDPASPIETDRVARQVAIALKAVSGNDALTDHHLRHSFACDVWRALECPPDRLDAQRALAAQRVRWLLLYEDRVTRRAPWALATILGHGHPSQGYRSYIHFLNERADELIHRRPGQAEPLPGAAPADTVDLDATPSRKPESSLAASAPAPTPFTAATLLLAIRMLTGNVSASSVAASLHLDLAALQEAQTTLSDIDERLADTDPDSPTPLHPKVRSKGLLAHLNVSNEARLVALLGAAINRATPPGRPLISGTDLAGMISRRAQIAMWLPDQMALVMSVVRALQLPREQLSIGYPARPDSDVIDAAVEMGLITSKQDVSVETTTNRLFPVSRRSSRRLEPTYLKNPRRYFRDRLALTLDSGADINIRNGYELIIAVISFWLYWRHKIDQAPTRVEPAGRKFL